MQENDDDIGALGSILSWDDDEQANDVVSGQNAALSAALREREFSSGTSAPPDMVQFSMKDGQFTFLQQSSGNLSTSSNNGDGMEDGPPTPQDENNNDLDNKMKKEGQVRAGEHV